MSEQIDITQVASEICNSYNLNLIEKVGEGAFKETFKISDNSTNQFALKIYKSVDFDTRTEREIKAILRCNHPCIAKIKYVNIFKYKTFDFLFLTEEFFDGGTLENLIQNKEILDRNTIIDLGIDLIEAISHLANLKLVHRDIKPANILFRKDSNKPIITDFGIVRDLQATSETKSWLPSGPGTPLFSAPEQLVNDKRLIDWRTDQFTLGITLSISAFGQHPFNHHGHVGVHIPEEVAKRGKTSNYFQSKIAETELVSLETMVAVWPAMRYRTPDLLLHEWIIQGR